MPDLNDPKPALAIRAEPVDVLSSTTSTLVTRVSLPHTSVIRKQALGPGALERTRHELRILARLAGVGGVVRLAADRGSDEIVLIDTHAEPLSVLIDRQRSGGTGLDPGAMVDFALELTRTVAAVHDAGVVHADITPMNVMVSGRRGVGLGRPLLIDFHLATTFVEGVPGFGHQREMVGTLPYLAPEQTGRTGMSVDERADLYGLGATLYELSTGRPPFPVADPLEMVHDVLTALPVPPGQLADRLPGALSDMIMRLLEKEPDRRYQSALRSGLRGVTDVVCRYGGEEFAAILPGADEATSVAAAERVRAAVAAVGQPHTGTAIGTVTISVGVAACGAPDQLPRAPRQAADLVAAADFGLYCAKEEGRNKVRLAPWPDGQARL